MKVFLTGEGFLGSYVRKKLLESLPLDYTHISHDKIQSTKLHPFDYFFYLSSYGNMVSQTDEDAIFKANVEDLLSILKQVVKLDFKCFVYVSSSSVALRTQTTYSRAKRAAEEILLAVMERNNKPICIIRPFSVTGIGEQQEHLIPTLIRAAFRGEQVNLDPKPTHDFIDVEDVVEGMINLSSNSAKGIYQLGTGVKTSNGEVLKLVEGATGKKIKVNIVSNLRPYDNEDWVSNNFKARSYGWLPKKTLKQSIEEMVDAYKRGLEEN